MRTRQHDTPTTEGIEMEGKDEPKVGASVECCGGPLRGEALPYSVPVIYLKRGRYKLLYRPGHSNKRAWVYNWEERQYAW